MNRRIALPVAALAVVLAIVLMSSVFTVHQTENALVLQFGKPVRPINQPGLQFKWPLVQEVFYFDNRILDLEPPQEEVIAADQKRLVVDSYARYRIADPLQFYQLVGTEANANARLSSIINSALRRVIGNVQLASVVADKRASVMQEVRDEVNAQAKSWGMNVIDVRIKRADLPAENSVAIYADAFNRDKDFFALYWSLEAYRRSLANGDTTLVLSPDSEFFRFFNSASGAGPAQAEAPKP